MTKYSITSIILLFLVILVKTAVLTRMNQNEQILQEFVCANNLFASSFYTQIQKSGVANFVTSPFSAATVLAFVQLGCKDEAAREIRNSLHFPDDHQIRIATQKSLALLRSKKKSYELDIANKMFIKKGFAVKEDFKEVANTVYKAGIEEVNFARKEKAAKKMNKWVEKHTNNKIHNLIDSNSLDNHTRSILINAIYFKGEWSQKFFETSTQLRDFYKDLNTVVKVKTMRLFKGRHFKYFENHELDAKFLEMPFKGGDISMTFALPNEKEGLASLENRIRQVLGPQNYKRVPVNIALPKFRIESRFELVDVFKKLGISKIFDENEADLSGIAGQKGDLVVSEAVQQTFIDVQEKGVEAAAATHAAIAVPLSLDISTVKPKEFIADHPFIFFLKAKDFIIFAGRVAAPDEL